MKIKYLFSTLVLGLTISIAACANYSSCGGYNSCAENSCSSCSYASNDDGCYPYGCTCSEPSCGSNPCLSRSTCCKVYGNVGRLEQE